MDFTTLAVQLSQDKLSVKKLSKKYGFHNFRSAVNMFGYQLGQAGQVGYFA